MRTKLGFNTRSPASVFSSPQDQWHYYLNRLTPYAFLAPYLIIFGIFDLFPVGFMAYISVHIWNPVEGFDNMTFVGLDNFTLSLTDKTMWQTLWNTLIMSLLSGLPQHLVALPLAYTLIMMGSKARHWLSTAYFLPYVTSTVVTSLIFYVIFSKNSGILNTLLAYLADAGWSRWLLGWLQALLPLGWVQEDSLIQYSVSFVVWWKYVGFHTILYTAGLTTLPKELHEAASLDGVNTWQRFRYISLPWLRPFIFFGVTLTLIGGMQLFNEPFVLTRAGQVASHSGQTISNYLYQIGWQWLDMGSAAAISWILFVIIGLLSCLYFWWFKHLSLGKT